MMRSAITTAALCLVACAASHGRGEDGGGLVDAGLDGAAVDARPADADLPDGLAPRCMEAPAAPCLALTSSTTFRTGDSRLGDTDLDGTLHGLAYAESPAVLYTYQFDDGPALPPSPSLWALQRFTTGGAADGEPVFLTEQHASAREWGGDLTAWEGEFVAGWRQERYDLAFTPPAAVGADTFTLRISAGLRAGPLHGGDLGFDIAVAAGLVMTAGGDGLLVSRVDGTGETVVVDTERPPWGEVKSAALASHRAIVVWSEDHDPGLSNEIATEAAVVTDSAVEAQARIFEPSSVLRGAPSVIASDDSVWVARYEVDLERLRESRIRIAHLDASLRRIEPDRWFAGWGGLTPAGMALVAWRGSPWLVWLTLDARYGASTVLYARPIPEPTCGYDVSDPVAVWRPEAGVGNVLLATASTDALWIAVPRVSGDGTADLYQFRSCE